MAYTKPEEDISTPPEPQQPVAPPEQVNDSTYNLDPSDADVRSKFRSFVSDQTIEREGQAASAAFWKPVGDLFDTIGTTLHNAAEPSAAVTEAGLGTIQAADLERRRSEILGPGPTSVSSQDPHSPRTIPEWFRNQTPSQSIIKKYQEQQRERKRLTNFEENVRGISKEAGLPVDDWRVIMNAGGRMREQNPSVNDALAAGLLDPINLAVAPIGDARTVSKIADIASGVKSGVQDAFRPGVARKFTLSQSTRDETGAVYNHSMEHDILDQQGNKVGRIKFHEEDPGQYNIDWVGSRRWEAPEKLSQQLGPSGLRDVIEQFAAAHPDAKQVSGFRIGGSYSPENVANRVDGGQTASRVVGNGTLDSLRARDAAKQPGIMRRFLTEEGGSINVDKIIQMLQKSKDPGTRSLADEVSRMRLEGKSDKQIYERLQGSADAFAAAKESGLVDSVTAEERKLRAVAENMARKGSRAEVEGLDVVSAGSRKRINRQDFNTQAEAQAYADEINKRVEARQAEFTPEMRDAISRGRQLQESLAESPITDTSAGEAQNIRTSFSARGSGQVTRLSKGQKSEIAKIVQEQLGGEGSPSQVKAIVDELMKANDTVRNQVPIEQAAAFDPKAFKGEFTKPGDFSNVKKVTPKPSLEYVIENFPPEEWAGQLEPRSASRIRQILLEDRMNKPNRIQSEGAGTFDERSGDLLFGDQPLPGELGSAPDWPSTGPDLHTPEEMRDIRQKARADFAGSKVTSEASGAFSPAKDFVDLKGPGVGDVQQAMIDEGFGMTGGGGRIRGLSRLSDGSFWDAMMSTPRQLKAMGDLSALFNQGAIPFVAHNNEWREFAANSAKSLASEKGYREVIKATKEIPTYEMGRRFGLASSFEEDLRVFATNAEREAAGMPRAARFEAFDRGVAREIPVLGKLVERSDKAYEAGLANLRANIFDTYANAWNLPERLKPTRADGSFKSLDEIAKAERTAKALADFVNSISGYGHLGAMEKASAQLNEVFFAPRFFASRINAMFAPFTYTASAAMGKTDWKLAYLAWRDFSMYSAGVVGTLKLAKAAGLQAEDDPRSARFGTIQLGNHYIDITGGMGRTVSVFNQSLQVPPFAGEVKTGSGRIAKTNNPEFGDRNGMQIMLSWLANKANVVPGEAMDLALLGNRNVVNEPMGIRGHIPVPIGFGSVLEAAAEDYQKMGIRGAIGGVLTAAPSLLGFGVNTYELGKDQPEVLHGFPEDQLTQLTGIGRPRSKKGGSFF